MAFLHDFEHQGGLIECAPVIEAMLRSSRRDRERECTDFRCAEVDGYVSLLLEWCCIHGYIKTVAQLRVFACRIMLPRGKHCQ